MRIVEIPVVLDVNVDEVISQQCRELTGEARESLTEAINMATAVKQVKDQKQAQKQSEDDKLTTVMIEAYNELEKAGLQGVKKTTIQGIIAGTVANMSAFTLRMKKILADKGNVYRLDSAKISGEPHYLFIPHNSGAAHADAESQHTESSSDS